MINFKLKTCEINNELVKELNHKEIGNKLEFIISEPGTGKTFMISEYIKKNHIKYNCILIVSIRKSYAKQIEERFIKLNKIKIIELELLYKHQCRENQLLILDEFESILYRAVMFPKNYIVQHLLHNIINSEQIISCDIHIEENILNFFKQNFSRIGIIRTNYKCFKGNIVNIHYYSKQSYILGIFNKLKQNNNIIGIVENTELIKELGKMCKSEEFLGIYEDNNCDIDVCDWIKYNYVFYTDSISVGIDFNEEHFDLFMAVYTFPMNPHLFVQGIFRARQFSKNEHHIFLPLINKKEKVIVDKNCNNELCEESMELNVIIRDIWSKNTKELECYDYIKKRLKQMGFCIKICPPDLTN